MAQQGVKILELSGYTGYFILVWKKATAPLTEVGRSAALPFPVISQTIVAPNLSLETYNFEFWQSSDGIALDTKIGTDWSIDATTANGALVTRYEYIVDRGNTEGTIGNGDYWIDPASDQAEIIDERYKGVSKEDVSVSMRGVGDRRADEWDLRADGGIAITAVDPGSGIPEVFAPQDSIFVTVFQKTTSVPAPSVASDYVDVKIVSADVTLDTTFKNKVIICTSSLPVTIITFPAFNTLADQKLKFITNAMTGNYLTLQFAVGDTIPFAGSNRNVIDLTQGRLFELLIKSGVAYVTSEISQSGYDVRGKREFSDDVKPHQLLRDGTVRDIDDFPGIIRWIQTLPGASIVTSFASWNTDANRHKYYLNTGANEFALPDDRDMHVRALKTFDGANGYTGANELDAMPLHYHEGTTGVLPTPIWGRGTVSRAKGNYDKQQNGVTDITGPPCNTDGSTITTSDEVKVKAVRQYAVINI